jgi:hypothetical protein
MAKEFGLKVAISTDAHSIANLEFMRFGVVKTRSCPSVAWQLLQRLVQKLDIGAAETEAAGERPQIDGISRSSAFSILLISRSLSSGGTQAVNRDEV